MTTSMCDRVTERIALGEPLAELSEHVSGCASCRGLVAVSSQLGATHHAVDPGLGFSARMTVGAQHRITVRRRRRIAAGIAASVAASALGVLIVTHIPPGHPGPDPVVAQPAARDPKPPEPDRNRDRVEEPTPDADLAALLQLADTDRSRHLSARWGRIKRPLAAYKKLVNEEANEEGDTP
jgi:hypothetical protein